MHCFNTKRYHHGLADRCNMYDERFNRYDQFHSHNSFYNHEHYLPDYMNSHDHGTIDCGSKEIPKNMEQSQNANNTMNIKNNLIKLQTTLLQTTLLQTTLLQTIIPLQNHLFII